MANNYHFFIPKVPHEEINPTYTEWGPLMELVPEKHPLRNIINQRISKYLPAGINMGDDTHEAHKLLLSIYPDLLYLMLYYKDYATPAYSV
jgi:hypothetical protein